MKLGDIVRVDDGSYSQALIKGKLEHIGNLQPERFRVVALEGNYPTPYHGTFLDDGSINDCMLVSVNDPDFVVFTQVRFCRVTSKADQTRRHKVIYHVGQEFLVDPSELDDGETPSKLFVGSVSVEGGVVTHLWLRGVGDVWSREYPVEKIKPVQ